MVLILLRTYLVVLSLRCEHVRPALLLHAEEAEVEVRVLEQQVCLEGPHAVRALGAHRADGRARGGRGDEFVRVGHGARVSGSGKKRDKM